jgi:hypothetical protein
VLDQQATEYLASLPEIETARLPIGTLFWANDRIYEVTETGTSGFHKARAWRQNEHTEVALIPDSFPSRHLPLVERGRLLPVYRSRLDLTRNNQATCFVFPIENLALDAAYLDVALIKSTGAFVRNHGNEPAFAVTDGVHVFRLYYYRVSAHGRASDLSSLRARPLPFTPQLHSDGPGYWRLLPSWTTIIPDVDTTQQISTIRFPADGHATLPSIRVQPPSDIKPPDT